MKTNTTINTLANAVRRILEVDDDGSTGRPKPSTNRTQLKTKLSEPSQHTYGLNRVDNLSKANPKTKNQFAAKFLRVLAANPEGIRRDDALIELGLRRKTHSTILSAMVKAGLMTATGGLNKITKTGKSWLAEVDRIK